jgi:oligopeptide/dipeptide ABC transporter ATP-binding protein
MTENCLLRVEHLVKRFPLGSGTMRLPWSKPLDWITAVDGVSFSVFRGENFGLVGESGCGKTTLGRLILRLIEPTDGRVEFDGQDIFQLNPAAMSFLRRRMQIIFQDPYSSLDPRMKVFSIITEPLRATQQLSRKEQRDVAGELLQKVGLRSVDLNKYPHEFSGGQRQRIGIARALCVRPELIIADEPVSALDVSIQAQVINLLEDLKAEFGLSYIFISHDLSVVEHICDRIAVMYFGKVVELAPTESFSRAPRHPYTEALLRAIPLPDPHRATEPFAMEGDVPNPLDPPTGCPFHPRCAYQFEKCSAEKPQLTEVGPKHFVACWLNQGKGLTD